MAYVTGNPKSKAAIKRAIAEGKRVTVFDPGFLGSIPTDGTVSIEGPHYPEPHKWYGRATLKGGKVIKIT